MVRKISPSCTSKQKIKNNIIRWLLYVVILFICIVISSAGSYQKPLLLIPSAIYISSFSKEFTSIIIGIVCGIMTDIICGSLLGFNAILLMLFCIITHLLYKNLLQQRVLNFIIVSAIFIFIQGVFNYFFFYAIWGYSNVSHIFFYKTLPVCGYTLISGIIIYAVINFINNRLPVE